MPELAAGPSAADLLRVVAALCLVIGLALLTGMLLRKGIPSRKARALRVVERLSLGKHTALWLIEADGRRLLLGSADKSLQLLSDFDPIDSPEQLPVDAVAALKPPISGEIGSFDTAVRAWLGRDDGRNHS